LFHPAVTAWFANHFAVPTPAQAQAWPAIQGGRNTLISAPTGSGKTLAAFLAAIDGLIRQGMDGDLPDITLPAAPAPQRLSHPDCRGFSP
jgi:ATP-dependent Lhr-like helicase